MRRRAWAEGRSETSMQEGVMKEPGLTETMGSSAELPLELLTKAILETCFPSRSVGMTLSAVLIYFDPELGYRERE